ncbi:MAG: ThuA domain-containing protein, partial [bacterium]|nr:ThuA domain-containing protein [bacterium]
MARALFIALAFTVCATTAFSAETDQSTAVTDRPLRAVVVTGGHSFDEKPFLAMFKEQPGIEFVHKHQKDDSELFESIDGWDYDVIVFYAMTQKISEKRRKNLLALLDRGVGLVALHHTIGAFDKWPKFHQLIGGKYIQKPETIAGKECPASTYLHDVDFALQVADAEHPVTR